jgi:RNA polymerase sigma-70 factor (ECF subfamily)
MPVIPFARRQRAPGIKTLRGRSILSDGRQRGRREKRLSDRDEARTFEQSLLGWLDDAYNLARWLLRDDQEAQDAVQDAFMRAMRYAGGFRGGDRRAWLLAIVRNVCYTQLSRSRASASNVVFDEEQHQGAGPSADPEAAALTRVDREALVRALEALPVEYREAIVMREMEGLSYKEIAGAAGVPIGTVMSRLARARERLRLALGGKAGEPGKPGRPGDVRELQRR